MKTVLIIGAGLALAFAFIFALFHVGGPSDSAIAAMASADTAQSAANAAQDARIAQAQADIGQQWHYTASKNEMAGGLDRFASIDSTNSVNFDSPYEGEQHAHLTIRKMADGKHYGMLLSIDRGQLLGGDQGNLETKLDDSPPATFDALRPDDGDSTTLFFYDALHIVDVRRGKNKFGNDWPLQDYVASMQHAKTMKVQVTAYQNGSPVFTFNVAGFDLAKLESAQ